MNAAVKKAAKAATTSSAHAKLVSGSIAEKPGRKTAALAGQTASKPSDSLQTRLQPSSKKVAAGTVQDVPSGETRPSEVVSSDKADAGVQDRSDKTAVSKVSEVATKTPKSAVAAAIDGGMLSDAQLLKMGEKEYMNAAQLAFFKARLQQLERDLLKNAGETTEHLRETVLVPDPADRATIEEEHALELRTRDRERKLLKKVQQSIASIDSGDYGWCEETGEPIGIPRLLARPTATLSLEAQQRRELKQKLYGD
ncbi:MAG: hypothetical protein NVSMB6_06060 [Burkholderiaceae bacterium]